MTVTAPTATPTGQRTPATPHVLGLRRAPRFIALGLVLMLLFALLFAALALRADPATPVLAVAEPVAAGQTISDQHLTVVRVVPDASMQVVDATDRATVVGRTAAVPLVAGSLLSPAHVGAQQWPPAGEAVVSVNVPSTGIPAGLAAGSPVTVLVSSPARGDTEDDLPVTVSASVVELAPPSPTGATAVSLLLDSADALRLASADGPVALVLNSPVG